MVLGHPAYHSYIYAMYNDHDIEICKSVVQDYHIPAVFHYKFESLQTSLREQQLAILREETKIKALESRANVFYTIVNTLHHVMANFMPTK